MELSELKRILGEIEYGINSNRRVLDFAISQEKSKGNVVSIDRAIRVLKEAQNNEYDMEPENQKIAVCYTGNPEITITYIIDSIVHSNNVTFCISEFKELNQALINIVIDSIRRCRYGNDWINFNSNYNELYLRDNKKYIDKIVYIGDYYECKKLSSFLGRDVEYNNYGYIKLFIDKTKYREEYEEIRRFAYKENIYLEVYSDEEDFISESKDEDYSVVFGDMTLINKIKRELRCGELLINAFPYNSYEFKINR